MPQVIITKYLPATNFKGSRIKATCERGSITVSYPHELSDDRKHIYVADLLVFKFVKEDEARYGTNRNPWSGPRVVGTLPDGSCVHVYSDFNNNVVIGCANQEDQQRLVATARRAKQKCGQVSPLHAGLLASALARSNV